MNMRSCKLLSVVVMICFSLFASADVENAQPNFLFIFADDQCYETIAALEHTDIDTPNLDRLVREGTTFTNAYNMGGWSGAICVASRTMINTGRFLWRAYRIEDRLSAEVSGKRTWPQLLRSVGYDAYMTGKWHVDANVGDMFNYVAHKRPGMPGPTNPEVYPDSYQRPKIGQPDPWTPQDPRYEGFWAGGKHWSEVLADDAEMFLERATDSENPFFMYLAFNAPHDPRQYPLEYGEPYPMERIAMPENYMEEYPYMEGMGAGRDLRDEKLAPWPRTEYAVKSHRRDYYAIITHMDEQIGRILDGLQVTGKADNTYIIFTADHGLAVGRHGFMGKQNMYEHSLKPPLILAGPGIPPGKQIDTRVYYQDVMPTTLELAGVEVPDYVEFKSLLPLINGEREEQYERIYGAYREHQRAVIEDDFKLIYYPKIDHYRMFNLAEDPFEMNDLVADANYSDQLLKLKKALVVLMEEMEDPVAEPTGPVWDTKKKVH